MLVLRVSPSCRISSTLLLIVHFGCCVPSTPRVELQRRNHHKSRCKAPSQHPCGEASHSHRPTAACRCRWLQRTLAAVSSRSPNGVGRGTRTAGRSMRHAAALQRLSVKQSRPTAPAATQRAIGRNNATLSSFFILFYSRCRSAPSPTPKISARLHKREETKRKGGTIPPSRSGPTLSSTHSHCRAGDRSHIAESTPQCAPHHRAVNNGRDAAMHRPAPFYRPSGFACPHMVANRIRVHTNPINPSLAEAR
ncbi:hypothetical protein ECC02_010866 [Trypanosoma cruzi]|uniref:Secreted protein n=1 Tax=Trypanosoma cruzi TaxID=5693 RepID=A0A7J6XRB3_TRYCR|nr:hypothetical protein ECC02_010866 [Trypanosoma cruzi]